MNETLTRQAEIIDHKVLTTHIEIVGAGAIGSFTALTLAKMGFTELTVWDDDEVDTVNLNSQFYRVSDVGKPKVKALADLIEDFTGVRITGIKGRVSSQTELGDNRILISAVDSMQARGELFNLAFEYGFEYFLDTRMAAEGLISYAVNLDDDKAVDNYKKTLYSDKDAIQERCTAKATMYCALACASHIAANVKAIAMGQEFCKTLFWEIPQFDYVSFKYNQPKEERDERPKQTADVHAG